MSAHPRSTKPFAWLARFRRLAWDYERLPATLAGLHFIACAYLLLHRAATLFEQVHNTLYWPAPWHARRCASVARVPSSPAHLTRERHAPDLRSTLA